MSASSLNSDLGTHQWFSSLRTLPSYRELRSSSWDEDMFLVSSSSTFLAFLLDRDIESWLSRVTGTFIPRSASAIEVPDCMEVMEVFRGCGGPRGNIGPYRPYGLQGPIRIDRHYEEFVTALREFISAGRQLCLSYFKWHSNPKRTSIEQLIHS